MNIEVKEVLSPSDIKRFIKFPHKLYKESKQYVPVLDLDERVDFGDVAGRVRAHYILLHAVCETLQII